MAEQITVKELNEIADNIRHLADSLAADMTEQAEITLRTSGSRIAGVEMGDLDRNDRLLLMAFIGWSAPIVASGDISSTEGAFAARAFLMGVLSKRALK